MRDASEIRSIFLAAERSREELDADYGPTRFVASPAAVYEDWAARTRQAREESVSGTYRDGISYGPHPRETFDFYDCGKRGAPLLIFIHGGFWRAMSRHESGLVAPHWRAAGVHVAVLDYALAPEVTLSEIVAQTRRGIARICAEAAHLGADPARIVVAGHSAGGHLAAITQCMDDAAPVRGLALLSGVFELAPVQGSYVNDIVSITDDEVRALSPLRHAPKRPLPLVVAVGEREPIAFHEQSRALAWNWREHGCAVDFQLVSRRNHFDLLDDFAQPQSVLGMAVRGLFDR